LLLNLQETTMADEPDLMPTLAEANAPVAVEQVPPELEERPSPSIR